MNLDRSLFAVFKPIRQPGETIYWAGRPHFFPYVAQGIPVLAFGVIWFAAWYKILAGATSARMLPVLLSVLFLLPSWASLLNLAGLLSRCRKAIYAITDRRILIREGAFATEFVSIDFGRITEVRVSQNPLEKALGVGTLWVCVSGTLKYGNNAEVFRAIQDPHEVCRKLTEISVSPIAIV